MTVTTTLAASCSIALARPVPADPGSRTNVWDFEGPGSGLAHTRVVAPVSFDRAPASW